METVSSLLMSEHTQDDDYFDQIVGALQEVAISP